MRELVGELKIRVVNLVKNVVRGHIGVVANPTATIISVMIRTITVAAVIMHKEIIYTHPDWLSIHQHPQNTHNIHHHHHRRVIMITTTVGAVMELIGEIIMAGGRTEIMVMSHPTYPKCRDWIL
jgi:hypothetical protein